MQSAARSFGGGWVVAVGIASDVTRVLGLTGISMVGVVMGSGAPSQADRANATGTNPTSIVLSFILSNVTLFHWLEVYRSQTIAFA